MDIGNLFAIGYLVLSTVLPIAAIAYVVHLVRRIRRLERDAPRRQS